MGPDALSTPESSKQLNLMVRSKTNLKSRSNAAVLSPDVIVSSLDDYDRPDPRKAVKPTVHHHWAWVRMAFLLAILIPLAVFGYFRNQYTSSMSRIQKSLNMWDDRAALQELKRLEKRSGLTAETAFLRARAYRHLGDDIAFAQFVELARQLGYPDAKVQTEKLLRDTQLGIVDDIDSAMANVMAMPDPELNEIGPAVTYGLLGKLQFTTVDAFLKFWLEQDPETPWVPLFRGMLSLSNRDGESAVQVLEQCAKKNPDFLPVYRQLASAYSLSRDSERAVFSLQRYLKSAPEDLDAIGVLAGSLSTLERGAEVVALVEPLVESGKATIELKSVLARVYISQNQPQKVVELLGNVAALWPEDVRIANLLAQAHQALGNNADAERFAQVAEAGQADVQSIDNRLARLLASADTAAEKHYELGHIFLHKQSRDDGVHWLNSALAVDPNYLPAHEDLVIYFTRSNQSQLAARHQRFINLRRGTQ
jgi:tetratricopeptide (TPR) repeat protein